MLSQNLTTYSMSVHIYSSCCLASKLHLKVNKSREECDKKNIYIYRHDVEQNYWIFIGSRRPGRLCSILARGGHTVKKETSAGRTCRPPIAPRSHYCQKDGGGSAVDTYPSSHTDGRIHKFMCLHISLPLPPPHPTAEKDAIYMSWREVTGSNQPGE